jgi:hypothetical protein
MKRALFTPQVEACLTLSWLQEVVLDFLEVQVHKTADAVMASHHFAPALLGASNYRRKHAKPSGSEILGILITNLTAIVGVVTWI